MYLMLIIIILSLIMVVSLLISVTRGSIWTAWPFVVISLIVFYFLRMISGPSSWIILMKAALARRMIASVLSLAFFHVQFFFSKCFRLHCLVSNQAHDLIQSSELLLDSNEFFIFTYLKDWKQHLLRIMFSSLLSSIITLLLRIVARFIYK